MILKLVPAAKQFLLSELIPQVEKIPPLGSWLQRRWNSGWEEFRGYALLNQVVGAAFRHRAVPGGA